MIRSANDGTGALRFTPKRGVKVGHHGKDGNVDDHQRGKEEKLVSEKKVKRLTLKMPQIFSQHLRLLRKDLEVGNDGDNEIAKGDGEKPGSLQHRLHRLRRLRVGELQPGDGEHNLGAGDHQVLNQLNEDRQLIRLDDLRHRELDFLNWKGKKCLKVFHNFVVYSPPPDRR